MKYFLSAKKIIILLFFTHCCVINLSSQNRSIEQKVKPAFKEYFGLPRVSIFLHLNKTTYVKGEDIWFKGYLYNRLKSTPFKEPLNIYVGIYDSDGNQLKKELFISKNGISQGQIKIDSTFSSGSFYLKAVTSWMRNFKEDDSYVQKFEVIEQKENAEDQPKTYASELDVQFLPEGGNAITEVQGVIGVKVVNKKGYGVSGLEGIIKDSSGDSITSFTTNRFGLAKFDLLPKKNEQYRAYIQNNSKERFLIPKIEDRGVGMSIKRISSNRVLILLWTNLATSRQKGRKTYSMLLHRDGLIKHLEVKFPKNESYVSYILDTKEFQSGINICTLIDGMGNPIAERLIFNSKGVETGELRTSVKTIKADSVELTIVKNKRPDSLQYLSVSILPSATQAYQQKKNIISTFLLSPYVRGFIEQPSYYFTDMSPKKESDLDLLLMIQGWSRFKWEDIYGSPPTKKYDYRTGLDIIGKLNFKLPKNHKLLLYPNKYEKPRVIKLKQSSDNFKLSNFYLEKGSVLNITLLDANGRLSRPNLYVRIESGINTDKIYNPSRDNQKMVNNRELTDFRFRDFILPDNTIQLEEVLVTEKNLKKRATSPLITERRLTKVTEKIEGNYPQLLDLIRSSGFNIWEKPNTGYDRIRITSKRPSALSLVPPSPRLYIDDIPYSDFNILQDFPTRKLESFLIDKSGNGEPGAAGGVIRVYTRKNDGLDGEGLYDNDAQKNFFSHTIKNGFTPIKEFYVPKYSNVTDDAFLNFGTVHWEPNIIVDKNGKTSFKFNNLGCNEFVVFIEGMGTDGALFSTSETFKLDYDN
jgi:hypothetical protein